LLTQIQLSYDIFQIRKLEILMLTTLKKYEKSD